MATVARAFLDTSVLLAGLIDFGSSARSAQSIMDAVAAGRIRDPQTAWHCCLEFYSVATRLPEEFRLTPDDAMTLVETEIVARLKIHQLAEKSRESFLARVRQDRVMGGRIYDAHIAEIARTAGAPMVVTENRRDFTTLLRHDIRVLSHDEFLAEL